jgi:hypothetical protein
MVRVLLSQLYNAGNSIQALHKKTLSRLGNTGRVFQRLLSQFQKYLELRTRGGSSCNDAGLIELEVELPTTSTYEISEFGIYFRVISGKEPDMIFPDVPIKGEIRGKTMFFLFPWLDMVPSKQYPLDLVIDATLITNGLNIGKSVTFKIQQNNG